MRDCDAARQYGRVHGDDVVDPAHPIGASMRRRLRSSWHADDIDPHRCRRLADDEAARPERFWIGEAKQVSLEPVGELHLCAFAIPAIEEIASYLRLLVLATLHHDEARISFTLALAAGTTFESIMTSQIKVCFAGDKRRLASADCIGQRSAAAASPKLRVSVPCRRWPPT